MNKVLTIDRGNTTTNVVVYEGDRLVMWSPLKDATVDAVMAAIAGCDGITHAILSTVAGDMPMLERSLARRGIKLLKLTHDTPLPIGVDYASRSTLGLDRVSAACGAAALYPGREVLIVDIGTAVTYDRVSAAGRFIGGNIAPGIGMRLNSLHHFTAALPQVESRGPAPVWGNDTVTAMRAGAVNGVAAEISWYRAQSPADTVVVLTGGWSEDMSKRLPFTVDVCRHLVNYGLKCIYSYNETD